MPYTRIAGVEGSAASSLSVWCPGCDDLHRITFGTAESWTFDGNEEAPTVEPSIKVTGAQWPVGHRWHKDNHRVEAGGETVCHSYLRSGVWEFLSDSTHVLTGQSVPMVPLPDYLFG